MSGIVGLSTKSETGLIPVMVLAAALPAGTGSGISGTPTGSLSWTRQGNLVHFWGVVYAGASTLNLGYPMLPYRMGAVPISVNVASFNVSVYVAGNRVDPSSKIVYWNITATGGGSVYEYYFDITYLTDQ